MFPKKFILQSQSKSAIKSQRKNVILSPKLYQLRNAIMFQNSIVKAFLSRTLLLFPRNSVGMLKLNTVTLFLLRNQEL